jgi:hypothetical protein
MEAEALSGVVSFALTEPLVNPAARAGKRAKAAGTLLKNRLYVKYSG